MLQDNFNKGKLPPQAVDIEEVLLGGMLLEKSTCQKILRILNPECFYKDAHQIIFRAIKEVSATTASQVDIVLVTNHLVKSGKLDLCGGAYYITFLTDRVASGANCMEYAFILIQKYLQRLLIQSSSEVINDCYNEGTDIFITIQKISKMLNEVNKMIYTKKISNYGESLDKVLFRITELAEGRQKNFGLQTGFEKQDRLTGGRCAGELVIIAARPSMGKTSFVVQEVLNELKRGYSIGFFSLEMTELELLNKMISNLSNVELLKLRRSKAISKEELQRVYDAGEKMSKFKLRMNDNAGITIDEIRAVSEIWKQENNIQAIYIDYIQLVKYVHEKNTNRDQALGAVSAGLKVLAKDLDISVVALSQIGRSAEKTSTKKPTLADLRESGSLEQDSDVVQFIFRPEYYGILEDETGNSLIGKAEVYFGKNRNGGLGKFITDFEGDFSRFTDERNTDSFKEPF